MTETQHKAALKEILGDLLKTYPEVKLAILFGSQATGNARPNSDVDVAVLASTPLSVDTKTALITDIGARLGQAADVVDLRTAGEPLLGEVLKGQRLFGADELYARLLTRHLLDTADFLPLQQRMLKERRDKWIHS